MADELRSILVPQPSNTTDFETDRWRQDVTNAINNLPFSIFSSTDGPNQSAITAPEGFFGIEVGNSSSLTKFWFKESGSTSTGWTPLGGNVIPFDLRVPAGVVSGVSGVNKFGNNPLINTATDPEDIWDAGGVHPGAFSSQTLAIRSDDTEDDAGGSGVSQVRIYGLTDWDTAEVSESITVNGTTPVLTTSTWVFVHRIEALNAGSAQSNAGNIGVIFSASDTTVAQISVGHGQSLMAIYGVPSVDKLYITDWYLTANKSGAPGSAQILLEVLSDPAGATPVWRVQSHLGVETGGSSSYEDHSFKPYKQFSGPAIVKCQVLEVSQNGFDVSAGFDGFLVKNTTVL